MSKDFVVIFGLDGTLLNTDLLIYKSYQYVFKKYKPDYQLSDEELLSFLGPDLKEIFRRYFDEQMVDELMAYYREYNHAHHEDYVVMYPTVKETLEILKQKGYALAVVTTKYKEAAMIGLDLFDISQYFDVIIGGDEVTCSKPNPEGILKAMEKTQCSKGVMIGDNISDILAGKNAGFYTIGVNWTPKGTKEVKKLNPDLMIDQMDEIVDFIEGVS